ncbi:MAG: hypothetical protein ACK5PW_06380, partial [Burkholderiales bacterium]
MSALASTWTAVPLRAVLVLAASGGLHWGAWQAIGAAPRRGPVMGPVRGGPTLAGVVPGAGPRAAG